MKISKYTAATTPADDDATVLVQGGTTKKVLLSVLKTFFGGGSAPTAENDFQVASGSPLAWAKKTLAETKTILGAVSSEDFTTIVKCTQAEYDALSPADPNTLYIILEE
jgi:hypothetical protein